MRCNPIFIVSSILLAIFGCFVNAGAWESNAQALGSLQSYTGILNMPTARVLLDWAVRLKIGTADPWAYYGGAIGIFDRFEFHGQFTKTNTIEAFPGYGYGDTKDKSAGMRAVLIKENEFFPQISAGFYDVIGTGLFPSRYIVASKMFGNFDLYFGKKQSTAYPL
ncbi:MAG: YjbH domain-containing protein [Pseudomonadota bacterium]